MVRTYSKTIIFVITDYGSFNNFLAEIAIELSRKNYKIHIFTGKEKVIKVEDKYNYDEYGICFHFFKFPRSFNLFNHFKVSTEIQRSIKEINPDIVSIHFTTGIFTTILNGKLPYRTIGTFHGLGYPTIENFIKKQIFKVVEIFSTSRLDQVWVLNKSDQNLLNTMFDNIFLLPTNGLGCDLTKFNPENYRSSKGSLREQYNIKESDIVISFTGRYVNFKGYDIVIKTFRYLENNFKNIKLVTMGGPDSIHPTGLNREEEEYLTNNPNIIDVGFTDNVQEFLAFTNIFFFPSKKEGVPVCIVEALAMVIPVITFDARGCNDLVQDNVTGILMPLDAQPQDFAEKISELLKDETILSEFRRNIVAIRDQLSRKHFLEHQLNYFESL